jgi:hypothetical protein
MATVTIGLDDKKKPKPDVDTLDLSSAPSPTTITFTLDSTASGYRFQTQTEDATYGIDLQGNPPAGTFSNWQPNNSTTPTSVSCSAANNDNKTWRYTITLINTSNGKATLVDPSIKDK